MKNPFFSVVRGAWVAACLSGCLATTQEIEDLRVDITRLRGDLSKAAGQQAEFQSSLQGNQADLLSQMSTLSGRLESLTVRLEENDARMASLASRLDDLDKNMSSRLEILSAGVSTTQKTAAAAPSKLFQLAYDDFMKRRYDGALKGFENYLDVYPDTAKAAEAQYYAGECRFAKKQWKEALAAYDAVIVRHGSSDIAPSAMLQKGAVLEKTGEKASAEKAYEALLKRFPDKTEAGAAKARLDFLRNPPPVEPREDAPKTSPTAKPAASTAPKAPATAPAPKPLPKKKSPASTRPKAID